jgi:hypothetical protein
LAGGHNDAACIQIGYSVFDGVVVEVEVHDYANVSARCCIAFGR